MAFEKKFGHHVHPGEPVDPLGDGAPDLSTDDKAMDKDLASESLPESQTTSSEDDTASSFVEDDQPMNGIGEKRLSDLEKTIDSIVDTPVKAQPPHGRTITASKVASLLGEYATELTSDAKAMKPNSAAHDVAKPSFIEEPPTYPDIPT